MIDSVVHFEPPEKSKKHRSFHATAERTPLSEHPTSTAQAVHHLCTARQRPVKLRLDPFHPFEARAVEKRWCCTPNFLRYDSPVYMYHGHEYHGHEVIVSQHETSPRSEIVAGWGVTAGCIYYALNTRNL